MCIVIILLIKHNYRKLFQSKKQLSEGKSVEFSTSQINLAQEISDPLISQSDNEGFSDESNTKLANEEIEEVRGDKEETHVKLETCDVESIIASESKSEVDIKEREALDETPSQSSGSKTTIVEGTGTIDVIAVVKENTSNDEQSKDEDLEQTVDLSPPMKFPRLAKEKKFIQKKKAEPKTKKQRKGNKSSAHIKIKSVKTEPEDVSDIPYPKGLKIFHLSNMKQKFVIENVCCSTNDSETANAEGAADGTATATLDVKTELPPHSSSETSPTSAGERIEIVDYTQIVGLEKENFNFDMNSDFNAVFDLYEK